MNSFKTGFVQGWFYISGIPVIFVDAVKKLLYILTVFLYLTVTSGVMIDLHYCMGNYQSFELYTHHEDDCGKCGMSLETPNGCCKCELKLVKLQVDQSSSFVTFTIPHIDAASGIPSGFMPASAISSQFFLIPVDYSPPEPHGPDLYLRNRVFRI